VAGWKLLAAAVFKSMPKPETTSPLSPLHRGEGAR